MLCSNGGRVGDVADVAFVAKWVAGSCLLSPDVDRRVGRLQEEGPGWGGNAQQGAL